MSPVADNNFEPEEDGQFQGFILIIYVLSSRLVMYLAFAGVNNLGFLVLQYQGNSSTHPNL